MQIFYESFLARRPLHEPNVFRFVDKSFLNRLGRASASPCLDLFITLLSLGAKGYQKLVSQRKASSRQTLFRLPDTLHVIVQYLTKILMCNN